MKTAVVLFNLGGPESLEAVRPFLVNLFSDPAIINLPATLRRPLARMIAAGREKKARAIYEKLGGGSPLPTHMREQARALEKALAATGSETRCFIALRHTPPRAAQTLAEVTAWGAERIVLLPMYPQYSTATTASSFAEFGTLLKEKKIPVPVFRIEDYPELPGFIEAMAALARPELERTRAEAQRKKLSPPLVLLTAHGLPERVIKSGDPYQKQCGQTARALRAALGLDESGAVLCYQSRVGPLKWIGPATDALVKKAGKEKRPLLVVPISFTAGNSETAYEIGMLYRDLALEAGCPLFASVPCVNAHPRFIGGLAELVKKTVESEGREVEGGR